MKKKVLAILAIVLCLAMVMMTACGGGSGSGGGESSGGESEAAEGGTFIVRSIGDPTSFNPDMVGDDNLYPIAQNIYLRLVGLDASKTGIVGEAAESWEYNDDASELTFHLRKDLVWTDGNPLDAGDVKYTFETIKNNASYYFNYAMANVSAIETPDDYTVVFKLGSPDASFLSSLAWYATFILSEEAYGGAENWDDAAANSEPVTCGPFKLDSYEQGVSVTLVRNDAFPEPAKLDKLIFSIIPDETTAVEALKNGEIDFMEAIPTASAGDVEATGLFNVYYNDYPSPVRFIYNCTKEPFDQAAVRVALAKAINKDEISTKVYNGYQTPEYSMYPSMVSAIANMDDVAPNFDIEGCKADLEAAGLKADADGYYIKGVRLVVFEGMGYPEMANLIKATMAEAGVEIEVQVYDFNGWVDKVLGGEFEIEMHGGFLGPDPSALTGRIGTTGGDNTGKYSNAKVDELLAQAVALGDMNDRIPLYKEVQKLLAADMPYVPVVSYSAPEAASNKFVNLPADGTGKWGWGNYGHTELA